MRSRERRPADEPVGLERLELDGVGADFVRGRDELSGQTHIAVVVDAGLRNEIDGLPFPDEPVAELDRAYHVSLVQSQILSLTQIPLVSFHQTRGSRKVSAMRSNSVSLIPT